MKLTNYLTLVQAQAVWDILLNKNKKSRKYCAEKAVTVKKSYKGKVQKL